MVYSSSSFEYLQYEFIARALSKTDIQFGIIDSYGPSADIVLVHDEKIYLTSSGVCTGLTGSDIDGITFLNMHPDMVISLLNCVKADFASFESKKKFILAKYTLFTEYILKNIDNSKDLHNDDEMNDEDHDLEVLNEISDYINTLLTSE